MKTNEKGLPWADISKSQISNLKSQIRQGDFVAREEEFLPGRFILRGETKTGAEIQFSVVNFPGWKVWTDGKEAAISDGNKYKLITVNVPAGTREIAGQFTNTPVRVLGNALSLISIVSFLGWGSIEWRNRCRNRSHFGNS
jgi:hypothetical protein